MSIFAVPSTWRLPELRAPRRVPGLIGVQRWRSPVVRAERLVAALDAAGAAAVGPGSRAQPGPGGVEIVIRPWEFGLPLLVVLELARARGWESSVDDADLSPQWGWQQPLTLVRAEAGARR